jgi:hypothetical protein
MLDYGEPLEDEDAAFEEYREIEIAARELEELEKQPLYGTIDDD